jgi:hypothetical protein
MRHAAADVARRSALRSFILECVAGCGWGGVAELGSCRWEHCVSSLLRGETDEATEQPDSYSHAPSSAQDVPSEEFEWN